MTPTSSSTGASTGIIIGAVGGLVVLLLVAAVVFGTEQVGAEFGSPELAGTSLPPMPHQVSLDTSATGLAAPEVFGQDYSGADVSITNDGRAKAIALVAHWCPHCQVEIPKVQEWVDAGGSVEGVDLYTVSSSINSSRTNYPPSEWLKREGWTAPVVVDDQSSSVHSAFGAGGFPFWVFLNADGTVAVRTAGQLSIEQLVQILNTLEK